LQVLSFTNTQQFSSFFKSSEQNLNQADGNFLLWLKMLNALEQGLMTDSQLTGFLVKKHFPFFSAWGLGKTPFWLWA